MNNSFAKALKAVFAGTLMFVTWPNAMADGVVVHGNVFGGGNQADVKINTEVNISTGQVEGNVYGGGNLGDVGTITKSPDYNFTWSANTGKCTVTISNGMIGPANGNADENHGQVFGAGKGEGTTFWCEKAIAYQAEVSVTGGTVKGNVYGGGQVGRVETNTEVTIGAASAGGTGAGTGEGTVGGEGTGGESTITRNPVISGSVYGAGAGLATHGYSALVRGDTKVTIQGYAQVAKSVYGGGETASVGRYGLNAQKMPNILVGGGKCELKVKDNAAIGEDVFGACKGVTPAYNNVQGNENRSKRMVTYDPDREVNPHVSGSENTFWNYYEDDHRFVWEYFTTPEAYSTYLETLALATHPEVTIEGNATIGRSVFGGGELGLTKGSVIVNIQGGTVEEDVYGGGALADTNTTELVADNYPTTEPTLNGDGSIKTREVSPTTTVNLLGGTIKGDAYGGGLGQLGDNPVEAVVHGDINVNLGSSVEDSSATGFYITKYTGDHSDVIKSGRIFGCNNLNGSPQGDVRVTVWKTVKGNTEKTAEENLKNAEATHSYHVAAVYGGGNLANYAPTATGKKAYVRIETCDVSIESVYGGGNAAEAPETNVLVRGAYEINEVFGGGNGKDPYTLNGTDWIANAGANVRGNATTLLTGGLVHGAYGGSNKRGTIFGNVSIDTGTGSTADNSTNAGCKLDVEKLVGAGKDADVNGDLVMVMGCKPDEKIPVVYAGADNANVNGDVMLTITSGKFGKVFGGNNAGGYILGRIRLNIEETAECNPAVPIEIDELYLGGNEAEYSMYGYYNDGTAETPVYKSRTASMAAITDQSAEGYTPAVTSIAGMEVRKTAPYAKPELNIISCTKIDKVYGGGYGAGATLYGDPIVNINMIPGKHTSSVSDKMNTLRLPSTDNSDKLGIIGDVFGGGNAAKIEGSTTVNIGTATKVDLVSTSQTGVDVKGAYIVGNVYGGGNEADVTGNTFVNICAKEETDGTYTSVAFAGASGVKITSKTVNGENVGGNVFGGGKGKADTFTCEKAMIGEDGKGLNADYTDGNTNVVICNGIIDGTVYGGGQIGRVERNTTVTIGLGNGEATGTPPTSAPEINGNVFGAGAGEEEHGYAALVRGNPTVTIQGNAKIGKSVYGGGEIASVARYKVAETVEEATEHGVAVDMPYVLENSDYGHCVVTIGGYAEIGPDNMKMYHDGVSPEIDKPDDYGHVFGAGKGVLPNVYTSFGLNSQEDESQNGPRRMVLYNSKVHTDSNWKWVDPTDTEHNKNVWEYFANEDKYFEFIKTLALATETQVTIGDHAFVKGSVYGGSENGLVQFDTDVTIQDHCQIGQGKEITTRYEDYTGGNLFELNAPPVKSGSGSEVVYYDLECASWDYDSSSGAPYDPNAKYLYNGKYYYDENHENDAAGGSIVGKDGHTYYGNVFGGGSGSVPYFDTNQGRSRYVMSAGWVKGNTNVTINGGHILTNVYGGNEATNVDGTATVTMNGGTVGVPRTLAQIDAHPVTCYLFGAGKGDQRVFFNKDTNVRDVEVEITGGKIFGSVFGGGEDGHVLRDVTMTIGKVTTTGEGDEAATTISGPTIGNWGTSYVDGNVFGGGRGFGGDAYTAGNIAGSVEMEIKGGNILGSIYGGGRLGSVGYGLFDAETDDGDPTPGYGEMRKDTDTETGFSTSNFFTNGRGHIDITISGGTIGNTHEYIIPNATNMAAAGIPEADRDISKWNDENKYWNTWRTYHNIPKTEFDTTTGHLMHTKGGNVFAGGMGRFYQLDGSTAISAVDWWKLGNVKSTKLTITGGNILSNVYGGGELGMVQGGSHTSEDNKTVSTEIIISGGTIGTDIADYTFGSVFGGGYGSLIEKFTHTGGKPDSYPKYIAGRVKGSTEVTISGSSTVVKASVYGGGEMAAVGESEVLLASTDPVVPGETLTGENGAPVEANTYVIISGGTIGKAKEGTTYFGGAKMGNVYGGGSGHNNTVRSGHIYGNTNVTISDGVIYHNVYGGGAYGSVGDFTYHLDNTTKKVDGISGRHADRTDTGTANVTITGGTIGYDGKENGMIFGSSRGDINQPEERDDYTAWVYNANVTIGTAATPASGTPDTEGYVAATPASGPDIKGSVYGSGENGHTFNNTVVTVNGGTIGIDDENDDGFTVTSNGTTYEGAAYPYRGNVYGGGCGTDKYYSNHALETHDGNGQLFNPLAGIVYGTTTVNITGGTVVRNVYGAGAMGSVGRTVTTTNSDNSTTTTYSGGSTTINVSGGVIGVSGTVGDGNVFGAARGDLSATGDYISQVRLTNVTVSGGTVKGNVYGGGELGDVGTIDKSDQTDYNYYWTDKDGSANIHGNNGISGTNNNTGICTVTVSGGTIGSDATTMNADGSFDNGNVFGGGKGSGSTWWCEKAIAYGTNVTVTAGTVKGSVYGGGEVGRVEDDAKVTIGSAPNDAPTINGSVFGAGKGLKTHGYSALVRGNAEVIVQGKSVVEGSVYGGGEIASVGKFHVDKGLPVKPMNGGTCKVLIQDEAQIGLSGTGHNVFGACKGVKSAYDLDNYKNFKSMQTEANGAKGTKGTDWDYYEDYPQGYTGHKFVWKYYTTEAAYLSFLKTLALTSNTHVTIDEDASVYGSVFGGGERGVTLGGVDVNITGGTVNEDVYGGGSLADSNVAMWNSELNQPVTWVELPELIAGTSATGYYTAESTDALITDPDAVVQSNTSYYANYKTNVNLTGGTVEGNVFGGGLGQLEKAAVNYTEEEAVAYNTEHSLTEDDADYKTTASVKVAAQSAVAAKVYGNVSVKLNEPTTSGQTTTYGNCEVKGTIFGCNNLNGSPQAGVDVHIYKTVKKNDSGTVIAKPDKNTNNYEVTAVYGGGNLAAYYPDDETVREAETTKAYVTIDGCELTSIGSVYGGGNAASVPATEVVVNGTYEIGEAFGGGNGKDDISYDGTNYVTNPGANVGYRAYPEGTNLDGRASYAYGIGKAHITIYGGTVHTVYGGSNLRGNVRVESRTTLEELGQCDYNVGDAFGGGNNADQDGDAILDVGCITGLDIAYGGASNADVNGDVILNLTNGTYGRVFGGNNEGGAIRGSIKVNIEETGCNPIVIGELYCGGNKAAYSVYGYNNDGSVKTSGDNPVPDPVLNVKSFTSIGKIFGGGYGEEAVMVANPTVNINVVKGRYSDEKVIAEGESVHGFDIPSHKAGDIGAIGSVFGGGNAAEVIGTPHVNIGTKVGEVIPLVSKPIEDSEGRAPSGPDWTSYQLVTVEGVDIRGNVYGAGNNAQVTGDTEVVIGKNNDIKTYSFTSYGSESGVDAWSSGLAQTTGVIKNGLAEVEILTNGKYVSYVGQKYYVAPNATADGTERTELKNKDGESLSPKLYVAVKPFEQKTYTFTSHSAENGGTQYSTGTAAPTGNFKTFGGQEYMQIVVLTNPNYVSWEGKTFYVSVNAKTDGSETTRLYKADGTAEDVWVSISEQ